MPGIWVVRGDFNLVRSSSERLNSAFCVTSSNHFNDFILNAHLSEYNMGGGRFTYMSSDG